ncbi:ABC transporter ATP-binding protein [Nocardioides limicola]|uniref:ABC transporter ATP-binding protein n=1 Tax=Nocardioides limicola TaxID=2803368 RepID=UPI00193B1E58|nr:ABC transporter ATP-binding protein [Nocardioides sp. DJM-14]
MTVTPVHEADELRSRVDAADTDGWRPGLVGDGPGGRGMRAMVRVLGAYRGPFAATALCGTGNQLTQVVAAVVAAYLTGLAVTGHSAAELVPWATALVALVLLRCAFLWGEAWIGHDLAFRMLAEVRMWLVRAFDRIGPLALIRRRSGDLLTRVMSDAEGLEVFYAHTAIYIVCTGVLTPMLLVTCAVVVTPMFALVLLPFVLLATVVPLALRRHNARHGADVRTGAAAVSTAVTDLTAGLRETLAFGAGARQREVILSATTRLATAERRQSSRAGAEAAATEVVLGAGVLAALFTALWLHDAGAITATMLPASVTLGAVTFLPVVTLLATTRVTGISAASASRVFDLLEEPASTPAPTQPHTPPPSVGEGGTVAIEDVWFRYDETGPWALAGVDLRFAPGETVALVGHSGAGKSTLGHLLLRYADPGRGRITLNGVDLRALSPAELSAWVGHVPQDVFLFHLTLAENLRLGCPGASDEELATACEAAGLTEVIAGLPQGLATVVGERGTRLSGGERQRVAIARALLRDTPVLVLDEAASQLDPLRELSVAAALERVRAGRTTLVIAHRLTTILAADRVVVMSQGEVVATGTHHELLALPQYADLVASQVRGAEPRTGA